MNSMTTKEAFLDALEQPSIRHKHPDSTVRNWKSRAKRDMLSLDFMIKFLQETGYHVKQAMQWVRPELAARHLNGNSTFLFNHNGEIPDEKLHLYKMLCTVRKQMDAELIEKWFVWCGAAYAQDYPARRSGMTAAAF